MCNKKDRGIIHHVEGAIFGESEKEIRMAWNFKRRRVFSETCSSASKLLVEEWLNLIKVYT